MISGDEEDGQQQAALKERQKEMRTNILAQLLDQDARARLNTIALTKPEKAKMVEDMLIGMVQRGRPMSKITEEQLKKMLQQLSSETQKTTTVKFDRRRAAIDSDED